MAIDKLNVHEIKPNSQCEGRRQDARPCKWIVFGKDGCLFFRMAGRRHANVLIQIYSYVLENGEKFNEIPADEFNFSVKRK